MGERRPVMVQFKNIERIRYRAFRARIRVQADETHITGDGGSATGVGLVMDWIYNEPEQTLSVTCTKPWWISEDVLAGKIRDFVKVIWDV
jgi:hypothetical protein